MSAGGGTSAGLPGRLAAAFLDSHLTPLIVAASLLMGLLAVAFTPPEEEPQILVPMVDVSVGYPGATPREVEEAITTPLEKALWGVPGVEYLYSTSMPGAALITVRFRVNEPLEPSLVKVNEQVAARAALMPSAATPPRVELRTIDDVPFLTLTLHSETLGGYELRRLALEAARAIETVPDAAKVEVIGGAARRIRVLADPAALQAHGLTLPELIPALRNASARAPAGTIVAGGREILIEAGPAIDDPEALAGLVVAVREGRPVYLGDVAGIVDGPGEPDHYVFFGRPGQEERQAVTLSIAKRPGSNATALSRRILDRVEGLEGTLLPASVVVTVTRDHGLTAAHKSSELMQHLLIATFSVVLLIALAMGWRASAVVGIAVPVTLALTLFIYFLFGYTLNRVTLFALIFSIGILVDDAIVVVENIHRHFAMKDGRSIRAAALDAVSEVGNPTILATFTVIAAILPMAFVRGLMGPYMRPIPVGASLAMLFSLAIAFVISPWAAIRLLKHDAAAGGAAAERREGWMDRLYRRGMEPLVRRAAWRWAFMGVVVLMLAGACSFVYFGGTRVKMLPFDNKSELQILLDMDEGTPLEETLRVARDMGRHLATVPEVENYQVYAGTAAPVSFSGLVRHYFLRRQAHGADIQVNLKEKAERPEQSHAIAARLRVPVTAIAAAHKGRVKVVEVPPGPPVLSTLVAEIYGPDAAQRSELARRVEALFLATEGVVDVDTSIPFPQPKWLIAVDREKAALHGIDPALAIETASAAIGDVPVTRLSRAREREPVPVLLGLPPARRAGQAASLDLRLPSPSGDSIRLGEVARLVETQEEPPILHKNLQPVVYVMADLAGEEESPVYAISRLNGALDALRAPAGYAIERWSTRQPDSTERLSMKWDGEWHITYEVFRDLGVAFALVLVLIYILVVGWFRSFVTPIVIMLPIPLSLIGILPGHYLFGAFFTATSMIGFIAGAGIIVRNSIILVDFIEQRLAQGMPLEQAVVDAGAVRFRPMLLTAAAVVVGAFVILFDPIFQGLALSLMMGEVAATLLSRVAVPVLYYMVKSRSIPA